MITMNDDDDDDNYAAIIDTTPLRTCQPLLVSVHRDARSSITQNAPAAAATRRRGWTVHRGGPKTGESDSVPDFHSPEIHVIENDRQRLVVLCLPPEFRTLKMDETPLGSCLLRELAVRDPVERSI